MRRAVRYAKYRMFGGTVWRCTVHRLPRRGRKRRLSRGHYRTVCSFCAGGTG